MTKIPTAEEFGNSMYKLAMESCNEFAIRMSIEFAKLHVKAALEVVIDKMDDTLAVSEYQKVRNAYPETNIK